MALAETEKNFGLKIVLKRFPQDVREELDKFLSRSSWQALTREFSIDVFRGLKVEALDLIPNLIDTSYPEFRDDVRGRLDIMKLMDSGNCQSFKGKSKVGLHSYFYRFWLIGQRNEKGLYDILFCHIARKEEFDLFLFLNKVMKGGAFTVAAAPKIFKELVGQLSERAKGLIQGGVFVAEEDDNPTTTAIPNKASPYTDLTENLGDRLTEYELVEDLIERGTLGENVDGTLFIQI